MKIVYAVEYIEIDFGERPEGYSLYLDKDECIKQTKYNSESGSYGSGGGYYGPVRPLSYIEVPWGSLEEGLQIKLTENNKTHTADRWSPKFRGNTESIS